MAPGYRGDASALASRRRAHQERVLQLDERFDEEVIERLTDKQRGELETLRGALVPADGSVAALIAAEEAADRLEGWLGEALELADELEEHMEPWLPRLPTMPGFSPLAEAPDLRDPAEVQPPLTAEQRRERATTWALFFVLVVAAVGVLALIVLEP